MSAPTVPTAAPPPPTTPRRRGLVAVAVAFVLLVTAVGSAQLLAEAVHGSSVRDSVLIPAVPYLQVTGTSGDVTLTASPDGAVHVRTEARYGLTAPELVEESTAAGVRLTANCRGFLGSGCQVDYHVAVPAGVAVSVSGVSGQVVARELTGRFDADLSSGDAVLTALGGDVAVHTYSGDVTATGLRSPSVIAQTRFGDVTVALAAAPRSVVAGTTSGNVDVALPVGQPYRVAAATVDGRQRVSVPTDPAATAAITATTESGDVTVHPG